MKSFCAAPGLADVGEGVEGAARQGRAKPRDFGQPPKQHIATLSESAHHFGNCTLRAFEGRATGLLRHVVHTGVVVHAEPHCEVDEALRPDGVAEPPAGHGVSLGPAVEQDQAVANPRIGEQALGGRLGVVDGPIDLVREQRDLGPVVEAANQGVEFNLGGAPAGGVPGAVQDDEPGRRGDSSQDVFGSQTEGRGFAKGVGDGRGTAHADDRAVDRKAGIGVEDLGARLSEAERPEEQPDLRAGQDHHVIR